MKDLKLRRFATHGELYNICARKSYLPVDDVLWIIGGELDDCFAEVVSDPAIHEILRDAKDPKVVPRAII